MTRPPRPRRRLGTHVLLDAWGAPFLVLDDPERVRSALEATVEAARLTLLAQELKQFEPQGVTALALLAESHLAIHTWPEHGAFAADLFHCGELSLREIPALMHDLADRLEATYWDYQVVERRARFVPAIVRLHAR
ncbi:MAG: adenosylmethionine decarboxylase [Thermoanaerobaculia bacterium]